MKTPILFCLWLISLALSSQNIVWEKAFNKSKSDRFRCVRSTSDDGCIWGGDFQSDYYTDSIYTDDHFNKVKGTEMWVVKLNALGNTEWEKTYGDSSDNYFQDVQNTRDGGYILLGNKFYEVTKSGRLAWKLDAMVVKINSTGKVEWEKYYSESQGFLDIKIIHQTKDGGYILGGTLKTRLKDSADIHTSRDDMLVYKIDSNGDIQWRETYRMPNSYYIQCIFQLSVDGYLLGGYSFSSDGDKRSIGQGQTMDFLIKINSKGKLKWEKNNCGLEDFRIFDIQLSSDGGYLLGGSCKPGKSVDFGVSKMNSKMHLKWSQSYGGSHMDYFKSIVSNPDGTFVIAGTTKSMNGDVKSGYRGEGDYWLVKVNAQGAILWEKTIGSSMDDYLGNAQRTSDGFYYLGGTIGHFVGPLDGDIDSKYFKEQTTEFIESDVKSITKSGRSNTWIVKVKD